MAKKTVYRVGGGCVLCMTCLYECPVRAIRLEPNVSAVIDETRCIGCGSCYDACQPGVIEPVEIEDKEG